MPNGNVLLVDTNRGSHPLLRALQSDGYNVTTVGSDPGAPLARLCEKYINIDYTNRRAFQHIVNEGSYSAIIPGCTDASYLACASLNGPALKGIDEETAISSIFNKQNLRAVAQILDIAQPRQLSETEALLSSDIIIKPVDSFSGSGIIKLQKPTSSSLQAAIKHAREMSPSQKIVIEEFIQGQLYSHSAFLSVQQIDCDYFVREDCSDYPYAVDTSCLAGSLSLDVQHQLRNSVTRLARELRLKDGLLHTQFIVKDETAYIIEMTRRHPGDLYGLLIQYSTGASYSSRYLNAFLSQPCQREPQRDGQAFIIRHTITAGLGRDFWSLSFKRKHLIRQLIPLAKAGDHLSAAPQGRVAVAFFEQHSKEEHEEVYDLLINRQMYEFLP